jgi:hexulose-6-phosphate isomerase
VPLVDGGSLEGLDQEDLLVEFLLEQENKVSDLGIKIIFESDFLPSNLHRFILRLNEKNFGINYDIGNSAALGLNPVDEFQAIGDRIYNVHVKDRPLKGTTVPLGEGDADFPMVFKLLQENNYTSNYILQTARAVSDDHSSVLSLYQRSVENWIKTSGP